MKTNEEYFYDNVRVKSPRGMRGEFLGLRVWQDEKGDHVYLYRYMVPGRCDSYSFTYNTGEHYGVGKLSYYSEFGYKLQKSLTQFKKDSKLPQVKKLFAEALKSPHAARLLKPMLGTLK